MMKMKKNIKAIELLSRSELALVKGGEDRKYYTVIINGEEVRIYV